MTDHEWSGAYVLGALDAEERHRFEQHLRECERCRREVASFAPIPGLLTRVDPDGGVAVPNSILDDVIRRTHDEWRRVVASRRRWRWAAAAAALVAVVLLASMAWSRFETAPTQLALAPDSLAAGTVTVESRAWGTAIALRLENLPPSDRYVAWAIDISGEWQQVAVWGPTMTSAATVAASSSIPLDRLDAVVITMGDNRDPVATARPRSG